jgi:hypothetical protein
LDAQRLIFIGNLDDFLELNLKVKPNPGWGAPDDHRYVALGHCWGGHLPVQLTTQTYKALETALLSSSCHRNFSMHLSQPGLFLSSLM